MSFAIRRYADADHAVVRDLFIRVNRELAPPALREAFESYIERSLSEEIDRLAEYYAAKQGAFFVAHEGDALAGMYGLEGIGTAAAELRRMYVGKAHRGNGLARAMLERAEATCRAAGTPVLTLSTSELQQAALAFYRKSGYQLVREETAAAQTNKTVGGDIRRSYFEKILLRSGRSWSPKLVTLAVIFAPCVRARLSARTPTVAPFRDNARFTIPGDLGTASRGFEMSIRRDGRAIAPGASAQPALALILNLLLISP